MGLNISKKYLVLKNALLVGLLCFLNIANAPTMEAQILASPVFDVGNNLIGGIQKVVMTASKAIREEILPWKESISKVQDFFKKASEKVSLVIKNLRMTHQLIKVEEDINTLFLKSIRQIDESDSVPNKWKHRWLLGQLYWESRNIFGVFDMANEDGLGGVIDDEGRIRIIRNTLKQARTVRRAMRLTIRRANKETYKIRRTQRELAVFKKFFETN